MGATFLFEMQFWFICKAVSFRQSCARFEPRCRSRVEGSGPHLFFASVKVPRPYPDTGWLKLAKKSNFTIRKFKKKIEKVIPRPASEALSWKVLFFLTFFEKNWDIWPSPEINHQIASFLCWFHFSGSDFMHKATFHKTTQKVDFCISISFKKMKKKNFLRVARSRFFCLMVGRTLTFWDVVSDRYWIIFVALSPVALW